MKPQRVEHLPSGSPHTTGVLDREPGKQLPSAPQESLGAGRKSGKTRAHSLPWSPSTDEQDDCQMAQY